MSASSERASDAGAPLREAYARGDSVVVEQTAAQFFEGRVLAVTGEQLRVQAAGDNDSLNVAAGDVYRLPPEPRELVVNTLAICGHAEAWVPCRVQTASGATIRASAATGESFDLPRERVLAPSALTELNLKRYFARQESQLAFGKSAQRAGDPRPEPGWHPSIHERLLVQINQDWFTGYVRGLGDDTALVALSAGERTATVAVSALAAEPPSSFVNELRRGDFVLLRPETSAAAWARWQVRAVDGTEIKLTDATGAQHSATVRDIVPLSP